MTLREDQVINPAGQKTIYGVVSIKRSVFIIALTDQKEIYLVGQYRYPTKMYSWEIPGGGAPKGQPLTAAKRELKEETGLTAKSWTKISEFQTFNGFCDEIGHIYLAQNLIQTNTNKQKEDGISQMKKVPFKQAIRMIKQGKITDSCSIVSIFLTAIKIPSKIPIVLNGLTAGPHLYGETIR